MLKNSSLGSGLSTTASQKTFAKLKFTEVCSLYNL